LFPSKFGFVLTNPIFVLVRYFSYFSRFSILNLGKKIRQSTKNLKIATYGCRRSKKLEIVPKTGKHRRNKKKQK